MRSSISTLWTCESLGFRGERDERDENDADLSFFDLSRLVEAMGMAVSLISLSRSNKQLPELIPVLLQGHLGFEAFSPWARSSSRRALARSSSLDASRRRTDLFLPFLPLPDHHLPRMEHRVAHPLVALYSSKPRPVRPLSSVDLLPFAQTRRPRKQAELDFPPSFFQTPPPSSSALLESQVGMMFSPRRSVKLEWTSLIDFGGGRINRRSEFASSSSLHLPLSLSLLPPFTDLSLTLIHPHVVFSMYRLLLEYRRAMSHNRDAMVRAFVFLFRFFRLVSFVSLRAFVD